MSNNRFAAPNAALTAVLASLVLAVAGLACFSGSYKVLTLLAGAACLYLLLRRELTPLRSVPALLLLAYVAFSGLTRFWALSGKFFLREYSKIFIAAVLFLAVMLTVRFDRGRMRWVMAVLAGVSTIYSVLSVEAASTGVSWRLLSSLFPAYRGVDVGFEAGTRLTGILGNANILSSVVALGVFFSICLLCGEEKGSLRLFWAGAAAANAFVFLLLFSMGGTACFLAAVVLYLIFAGKGRGGVLVRMLEVALPTLAWVFVAFPFFNRGGAAALVPLLALAGDVVSVVLLEKAVAGRLTGLLAGRSKLVLGVLAGVVLLCAAYAVLGVSLTGAYTFSGEALERGAYPSAGEHTLSVRSDGDVELTVISQNMSQVMMHTNTVLYQGGADGAAFTVPGDSEVCYFIFRAGNGTVLEEARLDTGEALKLKYTLLPGFIANRLQGLRANQNAIQRTVFFRDGMRMFAQSPLVGSGVGSFETGVTGVQDFYYETKYIHNHYIQILLEDGILGFVPFAGALLGMLWLLLRRRKEEEWEFGGEYAALWAAMGMILLHMAVEVSMSNIIFLCFAFVTFALVIRGCARCPEAAPAVKGAQRAKQRRRSKAVKGLSALLPAVFLLSLVCNMAAGSVARRASNSISEFLDNLELSVRLDPYEGNDAKLSFVMNACNSGLEADLSRANKYAGELLKVHSNTIPGALLEYYLGTGQYEKAFEAARAGAAYSASDAEVWNNAALSFRRALLDPGFPLLLVGDSELLTRGVMEYYGLLRERNAGSMESIALNLDSKDFFGRMRMVEAAGAAAGAVTDAMTTFLFDSRAACDADGDAVPDQVCASQGVSFDAGGAMRFQAGGWVELELRELAAPARAGLTVACSDPAAITVTAADGALLSGEAAGDGTVYAFTMSQGEGASLKLKISSSAGQDVAFLSARAEK